MLRENVGGWVDPAVAFVALFGAEPYAFWLDAGADATHGTSQMGAAGVGPSVLLARVPAAMEPLSGRRGERGGSEPSAAASAGAVIRLDPRSGTRQCEPDDLLTALRDARGASGRTDEPNGGAPPSGWVGWFGYEFGAVLSGAPIASRSEQAPPDAAWMRIDRFVSFDHSALTVTVCARAGADADVAEWVAATVLTLRALRSDRRASADGEPAPRAAASEVRRPAPPVGWRHDDAEYLGMIARCQEHITAGDAYQLCLTNTATVAAAVDPVRVYCELRASSPTGNGGLLRFGEWSLASASPERFLRVDPDGRIETRPIKGTRPRGATEADDLRLRDELLGDEKERAENLMIVDLMRNDLARIARLGTVEVTELLTVESYRHVHQLVSTVSARLVDGLDALDVVRSCFPAGSMTGAPKLAAMRILNALERGPRGVYAGSFGRLGDDGSLELAMVIRSIVIGADTATIGAGGGITALSVPEFELAEVTVKARAPIAAVYAAIV